MEQRRLSRDSPPMSMPLISRPRSSPSYKRIGALSLFLSFFCFFFSFFSGSLWCVVGFFLSFLFAQLRHVG